MRRISFFPCIIKKGTWILIYPGLLTGFGILVFFTNLRLMEFEVRYLVLFPLSSVVNVFGWFWMGSLQKNMQLMLEFREALFLVLHFSYYILMTFLMMLSILLLSMLIILLSTLMCDEVSDLWQQLELASDFESNLRDTVD